MKKAIKTKIISLILIFQINAEYISKIADIESYYSYKNEKLAPKNLYKFAPKLSREKKLQIKSWISKNKHKFNVERLLKNPKDWNQTGTLDILNNRLIEHELKTKIGRTNYLFSVDDLKLIFKISSFENRLWNIVRGNWGDDGFYAYGRGQLSVEKISSIKSTTKTYQTASRVAGYLVLKEALEKNNITDVALPDLFIYTIDGTDNIEDSNTIVFEPIIDYKELGQPLEKYIKNNTIDEQMIKNFALLIVEANLWNIKASLYINDNGNKKTLMNKQLKLFNLEQPNKARPQDAFLVQHSNFALGRDLQWNVITGLQQFYEILKKGKKNEAKILQEWILNGPKKEFLKKINGYDYLLKVTGIKQ
ncbi:hypothetical protein A3F66_02795 [candidate division TM6 bacterium RIFCSPHIGHO2_12_FULL_32_22]|nr:MAG: hypothetical protein A3F66_02795 [candidate division TM6 bacterium RIFCSPHIGHO2_12_FULL_32_22]